MSPRLATGSICPHCRAPLRAGARYCGHCGISIPWWDATWSLRRAVGGAVAGGVGWLAGHAFLRLAAPAADGAAPHPLFAMAAGLFLGMAGGLMEHSASRSWRGLAVGGAAGLALGFLVRAVGAGGGPGGALLANVVLWSAFGGAVGFSCGRLPGWEAAGGLVAGALGGALAWNFSLAMALQFPAGRWEVARGLEFLAGAILGALLWGGFALAGRLGVRRWSSPW